ncbi:protein ADRM1 [Trichinella spiralis]|nr:protein ADRM1 [Trichinella spiralis]
MSIVAFLPFVHHCESGRFPRTTTFIQLDEITSENESSDKAVCDKKEEHGCKEYVANGEAGASHQSETLIDVRKTAAAGIRGFAMLMTRRSAKFFIVYEVCQCATLWIPAVERGRADSRNLLVSQYPMTLKSATVKSTRSQGYVKCQCVILCKSGRCTCKRKNHTYTLHFILRCEYFMLILDQHYTEGRNRLYTMRKILVEFRAGKVCRIGSRMSFDRRLGTCFMYEEDDMSLHFCWREYDTVDVEDEPARKDSAYCKTVNKILEDYEEKEMHKQEQLLESSKDKITTGMQPDDIKSHSDSEIILRSRTRKHTSLKSDLQQVFDEFLAELRILNNEKTIFLQDYMRKQSSDDHTFHSNSENAVDIKSILLNDKEKVKTGKCPSSSRLLKEECIMKKKNEDTGFRSNAKKDKNNEKYLQSKADNGADMTKKNGQSEEE